MTVKVELNNFILESTLRELCHVEEEADAQVKERALKLAVEQFDFELRCKNESTRESQAEAHSKHKNVKDDSVLVESFFSIARHHLNQQIADHEGAHDYHDAVTLPCPVVKANVAGSQGQAEDHHTDAHQVDLK